MSFDQRLRDELAREAARVEPDVERQLGAVEARAVRRRSAGGPTLVLAAAIVVAALILRTNAAPVTPGPVGDGSPPAATTAPASTPPSPSDGPSAAAYPQIAGSYQVTLDPTDPAVARDHLAGMWTMRLQADGEVFLSAPSTFTAGANGLSGVAFSLVADRFRTNLFINDVCGTVGTYAWALAGGSLTLSPVADDCSIRRTLLAAQPWSELP